MSCSSPSSITRVAAVTATTTGARWITALLLAGVMLITVGLRLPGFALPLERDEGAYAYVAWAWLQGELPYRDAFDHKPPLIYLLYMPAVLVGTPAAWMIRLWGTLLMLVSVGFVFLIGRQIWSRSTALLAALLFGIIGSAFDIQGLILNTDQALVLPALLALWAAMRLRATQQPRYALATGAALAAAALIKPVAILLGPAALLALRGDGRSVARTSGSILLGGALVGLPFAIYFALQGAWADLWFGVVTYNTIYATESRMRWDLGALVDMLAPLMPLLLVAIGGAALASRSGSDSNAMAMTHGRLLIAWTAALLLAALGSLRPYIHYYYPLLPLLCLLAAPCVSWLWRQRAQVGGIRGIAGALAPLLLLLLLTGPFIRQNLRLIGATAEEQAERLYGDVGKHYFAQAPLVADFVRARTTPDDRIYIFAAEPEVYVLAERRAASRYIYDYPLALLPEARQALMRELAARPPALVITYYGVRPDGFWETLRAQNFEKIAEIGGYEIFGAP